MAGFSNDTMYAENVNFSGSKSPTVTTDGQLLIGSTASPNIKVGTITSPNGTLVIGYSSPNITMDLSGLGVAIDSLTPNSGTSPVVPDSNGNVTLQGTGSITTVGGLNSITPQLTGLTNHSVLVGAGTATITKLSVGTNGQVLVGATAADPAFATLTSSDSSISFTTGANTLSLQVAGGTTTGKTITGDTGGALSPTAGNWNLLGSGSITTSGSGSTLTTQLTGLTNHTVLVGAGTTTITKVAPSATSGIPLVSNGSSSDPSFTTAVVAGGGTGQTTLTNHGVLVGAGTSAITQLGTGSSGQVLQSGGASADPAYSTATYPSTATGTGTILRADGTNWAATTATYPNTTTANQLLYSSATNTVGGLSSANNGVLTTNGSGVPSIDTTNFQVLSTGVQVKGNNANTASPAGFLGEVQSSNVASASGVALTTTNAANVTTLTPTAGVYMIFGTIGYTGITTGTAEYASINTTSATIGTAAVNYTRVQHAIAADQELNTPIQIISTAGATVYYLIARADFSASSSPKAYGKIQAVRIG